MRPPARCDELNGPAKRAGDLSVSVRRQSATARKLNPGHFAFVRTETGVPIQLCAKRPQACFDRDDLGLPDDRTGMRLAAMRGLGEKPR